MGGSPVPVAARQPAHGLTHPSLNHWTPTLLIASRTTFIPPAERAAGEASRELRPAKRVHSARFQNVSTTGVDSRGLVETGGEKTGPSFRSRFELLAEKDERHRLVGKCLRFEFESLRRNEIARKSQGVRPYPPRVAVRLPTP